MMMMMMMMMMMLISGEHSGLMWKARAWKRTRKASPCQEARSSYTIISSNRFKRFLLNWQEIKHQIVVFTCTICIIIVFIFEVSGVNAFSVAN